MDLARGKTARRRLWRRAFEVRTSLEGNIYRVLFCLAGATMVLLHGFQKKSQKTPKAEVTLARRRMKDTEE
jgi:phage-related protein